MAGFQGSQDSVVTALQMPLTLGRLLRRGRAIAKALRENHPHRPRQMLRLHQLLVS